MQILVPARIAVLRKLTIPAEVAQVSAGLAFSFCLTPPKCQGQ